jgi:hypothetical protein
VTTIKLADQIRTNFSGYKKLVNFYHEASLFSSQEIHICIEDLEWIDANLSALLDAILHKLSSEQNLAFTIDIELAQEKFDVLLRNGFLRSTSASLDAQKSTLPNMHFDVTDKNAYIKYLEKWLIEHRGFPKKYNALKNSLIDQLIEVFCNSHYHSESRFPFFVSGQFFPSQKSLIFTMVDLGNGFLPKIAVSDPSVKDSLQAIQWALEGKSTKLRQEQTPGGLGIQGLIKYCAENNGGAQIITGDGFWSSEDANTIFSNGRIVPQPFLGTTVNLFFRA